MLLLVDNILNNYINIMSCLVLLYIPYFTKDKFFILFIIDILLNKIPIVSIILLMLYFFDKLLYKVLLKNKITTIIVSVINLLLFLTLLYFINNYSFSILYYFKYIIVSIIFNIFIYYLYICAYKK